MYIYSKYVTTCIYSWEVESCFASLVRERGKNGDIRRKSARMRVTIDDESVPFGGPGCNSHMTGQVTY